MRHLALGILVASACTDAVFVDEQTSAMTRRTEARRRLSAGGLHTCMVTISGTARCWGDNGNGEIGDGTTTDRDQATNVVGLTNVVDVVSADGYSLALRSDGTVWWWGAVGLTPSQVSGLPPIIQLSAAGGPMALAANNKVYRWSSTDPTPDEFDLDGTVVALARSGIGCAVMSDGDVKCWGTNDEGQLGNGTTTPSTAPTLALIDDVVEIDGGVHNCALRRDGTVWCWGRNWYGQAGPNSIGGNTLVPTQIPGITTAVRIGLTNQASCALLEDGTVTCWGRGTYGELGHGVFTNSATPVQVSGLANVTEIEGGALHACALSGGTAKCWGHNMNGALGNNSTTSSATPVSVVNGSYALAARAAVGTEHACSLRPNGQIKCWGEGSLGQLGHGTLADSLTPVVPMIGNVIDIDAHAHSTCAIEADGDLKCWGCPKFAVSTVCTSANALSAPTLVGLSNARQVRLGASHACAIVEGGGVRCWGVNSHGQLGNGTTTGSTAPIAVTGLTDAVALDLGSTHSCAIRSDGSVWCWGDNFYGQLGNNSTTQSLVPVQALMWARATSIGLHNARSCASSPFGHVYCWGSGAHGNGNGSQASSTIPSVVSSLTDVVAVDAGSSTGCALRANGRISCWGTNTFGERGTGSSNTADAFSPLPVLAAPPLSFTNAASFAMGFDTTCVVRGDNTVACWGLNNKGQVGSGDTTNRFLPTTVSGL